MRHRSFPYILLASTSIGCAGEAPGPRPLLVGAASDLAAAMPALAAAFEQETGVRVEATLGSSGQLAQQILQGAPIDVFLSADPGWIARLDSAGKLVPGTAAVYARGRLVVLTAPDAARRSIEQLGDPAVGRVAIANPEHAPYGRAGQQALAAAGVLEVLQDRLIIAENVRQTVQMVETGAVDAAVSALSLMRERTHNFTVVPEDLHEPLAQTAAVIGRRPQQLQAEAFLRFLVGPRGREILGGHAFALPVSS